MSSSCRARLQVEQESVAKDAADVAERGALVMVRLRRTLQSVAKDAADVAETWHGVLLCVGRAAHGLASWMNAFLVSVTALLVERGGVCVSR